MAVTGPVNGVDGGAEHAANPVSATVTESHRDMERLPNQETMTVPSIGRVTYLDIYLFAIPPTAC
jgi:hypothetical protein